MLFSNESDKKYFLFLKMQYQMSENATVGLTNFDQEFFLSNISLKLNEQVLDIQSFFKP